nr:hypothetical protein [Tanacetum cinerariifolium]
MVSKFEAQELEINSLKAKIKLLEDKDRGIAEQSGDDAPIKGRRKQQREFYTSVLRNQAGWKAKHFKEITLEEIKEKFDPVWKQIQDFVPIGSKDKAERFKRKGLRLEQESVKK